MIRTTKVGQHSLRVHARSKGEAVALARVLDTNEQVRTIGPKDEGAAGGSLLIVYSSKATRDAAVHVANAAPKFTPVADVPVTEPELHELDAADTTEEGDNDMATKTSANKRPKRGAAKKAATKKTPAKKAGAKKKAAKKKASAKKKAAAKKSGDKPRRGRPPGGGVGELVKTMMRAGKSEAQILARVTKAYPKSAIVERPGPHLAWYRNRVKVEDAEK